MRPEAGVARAADGPLLFARYAYPPNALGYCGADDPAALLERTAAGVSDRGLRETLRTFEGAWPYLELIAGANRLDDPLDRRVVEAYWLGNRLLDRVGAGALAASLQERFRPRAGRGWDGLVAPVAGGAVPHHSLHVLGVYPWVGLLRSGVVEHPLHVLDRCRVRWGQVVEVVGDLALVRSRPLVWDGRRLSLGDPRVERAVVGHGDLALTRPLQPGDWCALHWDWVCDRITAAQCRRLERYTVRHLALADTGAALGA